MKLTLQSKCHSAILFSFLESTCIKPIFIKSGVCCPAWLCLLNIYIYTQTHNQFLTPGQNNSFQILISFFFLSKTCLEFLYKFRNIKTLNFTAGVPSVHYQEQILSYNSQTPCTFYIIFFRVLLMKNKYLI